MTTRDPFECPKGIDGCGELHTACAAHNRRGMPCQAQPMLGTDPPRCRWHLGQRSEEVKAQYLVQRQANIMFRRAQEEASRYGVDPAQLDVLEELLKVADEALRWKKVCAQLVSQVEQIRYRSGAGEQLRSEVSLYRSALNDAAQILINLAKLGLDDRRKRILERDVDWLTSDLDRLLIDLGHDPDDPAVVGICERFLRTLGDDH